MSLVKVNNRNTTPYFNNVFDTLFSDALNNNYGVSKVPQVNILEMADAYKIELAAPGLTKEEFKIELKKNSLFVSAEKQVERKEEQMKYSRKEFEYLSFSRSFVMPEDVDSEKINAEYVNGVLNIIIGKKEKAKNEHKQIKIS